MTNLGSNQISLELLLCVFLLDLMYESALQMQERKRFIVLNA
jgi:hypothetical protein